MASTFNPESPTTDSDLFMLELNLAAQLLGFDPHTAFARAITGSLVHVFVIKEKIDMLPQKLQEDALGMFCFHLNLLPGLTDAECALANMSFEGIARMIWLFYAADANKNKYNSQSGFVPILIQNLPCILDWCRLTSKFSFDTIQKKGIERQSADDLRITADLLLALNLAGPDVRELLPDDVLSIAFTAWWYEDLTMVEWSRSLHAAAFINSHLREKLRRKPFAQFKVITDMVLTAANIASTALEKIQIALEQIRSEAGMFAFEALADNALIASYLQQCINFGDMTGVRQRWFRYEFRTEFKNCRNNASSQSEDRYNRTT